MSKPTILTSPEGFSRYPDGMLFSVNAGMPADTALEHASCLLACVHDLAASLMDDNAKGSEAAAIQYLAEMAKALVDASSCGMYDAEGGQ